MTNVTDFIKVEGVNTKVSEKLPEAFRNTLAGSVKTATGWLNVRKGVGIDKFEKGGTYSVELEISEKGNKTIVSILSLGDAPTTTTNGTAQSAAVAKTMKRNSDSYENNGKGAEAGGIYHDAVALAVGIGVTGVTEDEAVGLVNRLAERLLSGKRALQG